MIVDILGYRDWAYDLFADVSRGVEARHRDVSVHWHTVRDECRFDADLMFLIGWSELVPVEFYRGRTVIVLHPSRLPAYRGGSPIQHQIIDGLDESAVSLFLLDEQHPDVDSGPLVWQREYSLDGTLAHVLERIATVGAIGVIETIEAARWGVLTGVEQPSGGFTRKRRRPRESEITLHELATATARQLHDKIRALATPYPNAFVVGADGVRLYITDSRLGEDEPDGEAAGDKPAR